MANMANIKDTISKLLALSGSGNEHESRAALLKARELMAKHKLREIDLKRLDTMKVIDRLTTITCTKMTNTWATRLANVIAEHYCCRSYRRHRRNKKKVTIGLVGLEDDIDICESIFKYAFDCAAAGCKRIREEYKNCYLAKTIRQMENAYGNGFCEGVSNAFEAQDSENQEYGLVLVTPQAVVEHMSGMESAGAYGVVNYNGFRMDFAKQGYQDGLRFDPSTKLPGKPVDKLPS